MQILDAGRLRSRRARADDYDAIAAVVDQRRTGRSWRPCRWLFLDHFHHSSLVIDGPDGPVAFLVGILSPADQRRAYIHFAGVAPQARHAGLARRLYEEFFALARADGRRVVSAVTAPGNAGPLSPFTSRWGSRWPGRSRTTTARAAVSSRSSERSDRRPGPVSPAQLGEPSPGQPGTTLARTTVRRRTHDAGTRRAGGQPPARDRPAAIRTNKDAHLGSVKAPRTPPKELARWARLC